MIKKTVVIFLISIMMSCLASCNLSKKDNWQEKGWDLSLPTLGQDGWYEVFVDEFDGDELNPEIWTYSPHGLRWESDSNNPSHANY